MPKIVPIVEGYGEVNAVRDLLYKLLRHTKRYDIHIGSPKNAHGKANLTRPDGLERFLKIASREPDAGAVLVLLDADDDCPKGLAKSLGDRVRAGGSPCPVVIVIANRMYENWFIASLKTTLPDNTVSATNAPLLSDPESTNGKVYISRCLGQNRIYKETTDQQAMTKLLDVDLAQLNSRSFRRMVHAVEEVVGAIDTGNRTFITPP